MTVMPPIGEAHLRIARPTDHMQAVVGFYRDGLGFEVLGSFEDHGGFDGVMLGHRGAPYHLEFTRHRGRLAGGAPTRDNLLVFYLPDAEAWREAVARMRGHGHEPVEPYNPYWGVGGETFEDADGYRVVLQQAAWPAGGTP
jgi:catechol 2,3-dioxygenase-like lactoylglutathione lyase family enzyme